MQIFIETTIICTLCYIGIGTFFVLCNAFINGYFGATMQQKDYFSIFTWPIEIMLLLGIITNTIVIFINSKIKK